MNKFFFVLFIIILQQFHAQSSCGYITIKGKVIDTLRPQSFYQTVVYNKTKGTAVFGQPDGSFLIQAKLLDTIVVSVKEYPKETFVVEEEISCSYIKVIVLKYKSKKLNEVILRPIKTAAEIKELRQRLVLEKTRTVTGIAALQSPISYLYETFSKKERNKRWIAEMKLEDKQMALVKEYIRTCIAYNLITLAENQIDDFIIYLDMDTNFFRTASDYNLALYVKQKFKNFVSNR
ncbi:MAG: hypothetical protein FJY17_03585 [Bacteroidetes bacterium]|nr:hypothetical protein [Bacteroidota bacterium]